MVYTTLPMLGSGQPVGWWWADHREKVLEFRADAADQPLRTTQRGGNWKVDKRVSIKVKASACSC